MKNFIIAIALILSSIAGKAKTNIALVWINFAECSTCLNSLSFFSEELTKNIDCKLVLRTKDVNAFNEYNKEFFDNTLKIEDVIFSDNLYTRYTRITSTFFIVDKTTDSIEAEIAFKYLRNYKNLIYSFFETTISAQKVKKSSLPSNMALSNFIAPKSFTNSYILCDHAFKKFIAYDFDTSWKEIFKLTDNNKIKIYNGLNTTRNTYEVYKATMDKYKEYFPAPFSIGDFYCYGDTLYVGIQLGNYVLNDEGINFYFVNGIITVYDNEIITVVRFEENPLNNSVSYNINKVFYRNKDNSSLTVSVIKDNSSEVKNHMAVGKILNNVFLIDSCLGNTLPSYYVKNKLNYDLSSKLQNDKYYWFGEFPTVISKKDNKEITLGFEIPDQSMSQILQDAANSFFLCDVINENNLLKCIYRKNKKYFISWHNTDGSIVSQNEIDFGEKGLLFSLLSFYKDSNHIIATPFTEKNTAVFYELKKKTP